MDNGGIWPADEGYFQNIRETYLQERIEQLTKELADKDKLIEQMREALKQIRGALNWYKEQVSNCNRKGDIGETARDQLAKDVGKRAKAALSAAERVFK
ncbi:MAG: hypothetical protein WCT23_09560 [Candidatus Neomarinimicrobiota bacterium]